MVALKKGVVTMSRRQFYPFLSLILAVAVCLTACGGGGGGSSSGGASAGGNAVANVQVTTGATTAARVKVVVA